MDFRTEDRFRSDLDVVLAAYADPTLAAAVGALSPLSAGELVGHQRTGGGTELRFRYAYQGDLPPGASAIVDPSRLTWVQVTTLQPDQRRALVALEPDHYADRLKASAVQRFEALPTGGTRRVTEGRLAVKVLLAGKAVERALVSGLEEWLANEALAVDRWIEGTGG